MYIKFPPVIIGCTQVLLTPDASLEAKQAPSQSVGPSLG